MDPSPCRSGVPRTISPEPRGPHPRVSPRGARCHSHILENVRMTPLANSRRSPAWCRLRAPNDRAAAHRELICRPSLSRQRGSFPACRGGHFPITPPRQDPHNADTRHSHILENVRMTLASQLRTLASKLPGTQPRSTAARCPKRRHAACRSGGSAAASRPAGDVTSRSRRRGKIHTTPTRAILTFLRM